MLVTFPRVWHLWQNGMQMEMGSTALSTRMVL